jgi:hypothetical protein
MRDIRADLEDRAHSVEQLIKAENARFETLVSQLEAEQDSRLEHLRDQLRLAKKLLEFTAWQDKVRAALAARIACAEAAEYSIKKSLGTGAELIGSSRPPSPAEAQVAL